MKKVLSLLLGFALVILLSCDDDEEKHPKIETTKITATSASEIIAQGNIIATGSIKVKEFGFLYSYQEHVDFNTANKVSMGSNAAGGSFEKRISLGLNNNNYFAHTVFIRAYLTNEKGTVFGETKSVNLPILSAFSVSPLSAKEGDLITITGNNFSTEKTNNIVKFNETIAEVVEATATQLIVKVPAGIVTYYYDNEIPISVSTGTQTVIATYEFELLASVTNFAPTSGTFGTTVTIYGNNIATSSYNTYVKVGDITVSTYNLTNTSVSFSIPNNVTSEVLSIKLILNGNVIDVPGEFTINRPVITSLSPATGISGTVITLTGSNFKTADYYSGNGTVTIGDVEANILSSSSTAIEASIPTGLSKGKYTVTLNTGVHTVVAPEQFELASPEIANFSPQSGGTGTYVTIEGSNFGSVSYNSSVLFGDYAASVYSWTENMIQVQVPYGLEGSYKITVNSGGQSVTSSDEFTINP